MKTAILLIMLGLSGCAAAAPVALGTGSAVADIVLGEVIRAGAATVAEEVVPQAWAMLGSGPSLLGFLPGRRQKMTTVRGVTFVGEWR